MIGHPRGISEVLNIRRRRGGSGPPRVTPTLHRTEILYTYARIRKKNVGRIPEDETTSCVFGPLRMMAAMAPGRTWAACLHLDAVLALRLHAHGRDGPHAPGRVDLTPRRESDFS